MSRRKAAHDRKTEIISALLVLADRIGPDRLTTAEIARDVGVTQAAIFRHFPTKAELWVAVGEWISDRLRQAWSTALNSGREPEDRLRGLIIAQLAQIEDCPAIPSILFSRELNVDNPDLRECFHDLMLIFQGHLVTNLEAMRAAGKIRHDLTSGDGAIFLTSLVQGLAIRWGLDSRRFALVDEGSRLLDRQLRLFQPGGG
jgi:TetR/AcrR family transcriptional regulator